MAKCYVGTFKKYNEGNLFGAWLDLATYASYTEFLAACHALHKDESDPEFMIQDWEDIPEGFAAPEWISEQEFNEIKAAEQEAEQNEEKSAVVIVDYSDKAFALVGETKAIKDDLKRLGGRFNSKLSCGAGWIFSKRVLDEVKKYLASGDIAAYNGSTNTTKTQRDEALWDEYKRRINAAEDGKQEAVARWLKGVANIMMTDCGVILEFSKQKIDAGTFWFHDEGENYEYYKQVTENDQTKAEYFITENLANYDELINEMTARKDRRGFETIPILHEMSWYHKGCLGIGNHITMETEWDAQELEQDPRTKDITHRMTENDFNKALAILKDERDKFEKRLQAYLKRYGTSKLHFGTYWADR